MTTDEGSVIKQIVAVVMILAVLLEGVLVGVVTPENGIVATILAVIAWLLLHGAGQSTGLAKALAGLTDPVGVTQAIVGMIILGVVEVYLLRGGFDGATMQAVVILIASLDGYTGGVSRGVIAGKTLGGLKGPP